MMRCYCRYNNAFDQIEYAMKLKALLILCVLALLQGCVIAAVGGAAAAGYVIGQDERTVEQIARDAGITSSIKASLISDKQIKAFNINVDTYAKVVSLHGFVNSKAEETRAIRLASDVKGVEKVVSKLEIVEIVVEERS